MTVSAATTSSRIDCRPPSPADASGAHALVCGSPPLDTNSVYAYLLVCSHFAGTSVIAERAGAIVGFLSAYILPDTPDELFVWQVAVASQARGQGLAHQMIRHVLAREACRHVRYLQTTVTVDNLPSRRLFRAIALEHRAPVAESVAFAPSAFGTTEHAAEHLLRIGPMQPSSDTYL